MLNAMTTLQTASLGTAKRYRLAREAADLKQEQLAALIGVARTTIGEWEAGRTEPSASKLVALADVTGQSIDFFVEGLRVDIERRALRMREMKPEDVMDWGTDTTAAPSVDEAADSVRPKGLEPLTF